LPAEAGLRLLEVWKGNRETLMTATSATTTGTTCWSCQASTAGEHFCAACGKIQPLPRGADYFQMFGLPRILCIDLAALEAKFHQLSWKLHPDNFVRAPESERELSLERSSQLNDAYRALRDPVARAEYLLEIEGMRKEGATKQQAPPELLEEVFELNESLDELRIARGSLSARSEVSELRGRLEEAGKNFEAKLRDVDADLMAAAKEWDEALDSRKNGDAGAAPRNALLARMNEILNRRSYIRNLVANVEKELAGE
jgi:molecular chaperone HscB